MGEQNERELVVLCSRGLDDERCIVAWTIANVAIDSGQPVTMFLARAGVDAVRKGAAKHMQLNPTDPPLQELVDNFVAKQGTIYVCPPCRSTGATTPRPSSKAWRSWARFRCTTS